MSQAEATVREDMAVIADRALHAARQSVAHAKEKVGTACDQGREKLRSAEGQFEDYVREHPVRSVLIAAGVGTLLGVLWRR